MLRELKILFNRCDHQNGHENELALVGKLEYSCSDGKRKQHPFVSQARNELACR
ncbi:hypothetical protein CDL15_Pgr017149 [Punica granatum]|uniref:Uncharacterized protein n=1 Tax=Punica granatum TaxID=22663 RepID=A0A218W0K7_PUNGR|nr:hypothetical protein CDL15_Pgr017149 [Punica granatum]